MSQIDLKQLTANNKIFSEMDKEVESFYNLLKEKNIEPKTLNEVERTEKFFSASLKKILSIIEGSSYDKESKKLMRVHGTIDFYGRFSERFNLDFDQLAAYMGKSNLEELKKAMEDFKTLY